MTTDSLQQWIEECVREILEGTVSEQWHTEEDLVIHAQRLSESHPLRLDIYRVHQLPESQRLALLGRMIRYGAAQTHTRRLMQLQGRKD